MSNVNVTAKDGNLGNQMDLASAAQPGEVAFNKDAYGVGTKVQAHHLIPTEVARDFETFFQTLAN